MGNNLMIPTIACKIDRAKSRLNNVCRWLVVLWIVARTNALAVAMVALAHHQIHQGRPSQSHQNQSRLCLNLVIHQNPRHQKHLNNLHLNLSHQSMNLLNRKNRKTSMSYQNKRSLLNHNRLNLKILLNQNNQNQRSHLSLNNHRYLSLLNRFHHQMKHKDQHRMIHMMHLRLKIVVLRHHPR